jgi:hypothetical protein
MTAVPFTPVRGYGKQTNMGATIKRYSSSRHAWGQGQMSKMIAIIDDDKAN